MSDDTGKISEPLKPQDILKVATLEPSEVTAQQRKFEARFTDHAVGAQAEYAHLSGLKDHYFHKKWWSWFLMGLMTLMILFQSGLLIAVGLGGLDFKDYAWLLPALLVQNLGQIIALAYVVVKSLFR